MRNQLRVGIIAAVCCAAGITVYAAGGAKRTSELCAIDDDCARGHCYTKQNGSKVCIDCSASTISDLRGQVERFCKDEPRGCNDIPRGDEVSERYFDVRIQNGERCINARKNENSQCWDGGDQGHKDAVDLAEKTKKICYDELSSRKGNGGIYECSESTYTSRARDADFACGAIGRGCEEWSKDAKVVECRQIEDAMKRGDACVTSVERLDSDCLPRLSRTRETQFANGKRTYDSCKEILAYKTNNKFCK